MPQEIDYKQEWTGCSLKEDTDDPECEHYGLDCAECEVHLKDVKEWEQAKAEHQEEMKKRGFLCKECGARMVPKQVKIKTKLTEFEATRFVCSSTVCPSLNNQEKR